MENTTYYQTDRDMALNKAKEYYKNNSERLKRQARDKYRKLSEEDRNKKREYGKIEIKKENMEKIDIVICLKKRSKNQKNIKNKDIKEQKSLVIIMNKTVV